MLDKIKSGTIRVALALALVASAYTMSNAQSVDIPLPVSDPDIQGVVNPIKNDPMVKSVMNGVRDQVITDMTNRPLDQLPLYTTIMGKMQPMMMQKIMAVQAQGLKNPNGGIPGMIAPPPF
ncbi:hypothetical protein [Candidatus Electrothrix sp.]|uniref:hypothetical protein n=1 Tax=Candidatus Electrothrix sp. TaxID=2170559 RepID=UPI004055FEDD